MPIYHLIEGMLIGLVVAVPVGPLGLLCINRALMMGPVCGLFSGLGVATADALAAGIAALGISLISGFLLEHQILLRLVGGIVLCFLGFRIYQTKPAEKLPVSSINGLLSAYDSFFRGNLCRLACAELARPLFRRGGAHAWSLYRLGAVVARDIYRFDNVSGKVRS